MSASKLGRTTNQEGFKALQACLHQRLATDLGWTVILVLLILGATVAVALSA